MMDRFAETLSWRDVALYVVGFALGEVLGNLLRAYFPPPPVLAFKISATVSAFGLFALISWLIPTPGDAQIRNLQRSTAGGLCLGIWLGYHIF